MKKSVSKIFVFDTSVLLFDHTCLFKFEENDIVIPSPVLQELDKFKVGNETINFESRSSIRTIEKFFHGLSDTSGTQIDGEKLGMISVRSPYSDSVDYEGKTTAVNVFGERCNDNYILDTALTSKLLNPEVEVILVSKDVNLRLKAKSLGLGSQDYLNGKLDEKSFSDYQDTGAIKGDGGEIILDDPTVIDYLYNSKDGSLKIEGDLLDLISIPWIRNTYYTLKCEASSILVRVGAKKTLYRVEKKYAYNIRPKNVEQTFGMDALMNPDISLVALNGVAGTGKTLLALAAALEQNNDYEYIMLARPVIPLKNQDVGFLPGDANDKVAPYMEPLFDNLKFIKSQCKGEKSRKSAKIDSLQKDGTLELTALAFIRGRSLNNTFMIVDEAQNLTPLEIKTIVTRAGKGTKIIFSGDVNQIDTPYLDERSNGLAYLIDKMRGQSLFAHVKLVKGERSALANLANKLL